MDKEYLENLVGAEAAQDIYERHCRKLQAVKVDAALSRAVERCGGRNERAIRALLDESALLEAENLNEAAEAAVAALKKENGWLFAMPQVSSPGTGALTVTHTPTMADVSKMSMAEYRRYRQGK